MSTIASTATSSPAATDATYEAAVTGLGDHALHCAVGQCVPETVHVVSHRLCDDEPVMNVSTVNGAFLLRALGLLPELGAAAVAALPEQTPTPACVDTADLTGVCGALDFLARVDLALALSLVPGSNFIDCGRPAGYLQDRLHELRAIVVFAHAHQRRVSWASSDTGAEARNRPPVRRTGRTPGNHPAASSERRPARHRRELRQRPRAELSTGPGPAVGGGERGCGPAQEHHKSVVNTHSGAPGLRGRLRGSQATGRREIRPH